MRRAVKFGDAWHPIGARVDWLRDRGLPRLTRIADEAGRRRHSLAPRIYCRLTDSPIPDDQRVAGEGTLDQVKRDIHELQELGATHVHLDTKRNSLTADSTRHRDEAFTALSCLSRKVSTWSRRASDETNLPIAEHGRDRRFRKGGLRSV